MAGDVFDLVAVGLAAICGVVAAASVLRRL